MYRIIYLILPLLFCAKPSSGQSEAFDLSFYCDVMANAYEDKNRVIAGTHFNALFENLLSETGSFDNDFKELKWVSIKKSSQDFRIITWQLKEDDNTFKYYGFIQFADGKLVKLVDHSSEMIYVTNVTLEADDWFGALYYNMVEVGKGKDRHYLLFGYNGHNSEEHIKVVDVLHFKDNRPVFGKSVFYDSNQEVSKRIYLRYFAEANVNCNYDGQSKMIIHDFLVPRVTTPIGKRVANIPDGSYVAYSQKNSIWKKIDKLETSEPMNVSSRQKSSPRNQRPLGNKKRE